MLTHFGHYLRNIRLFLIFLIKMLRANTFFYIRLVNIVIFVKPFIQNYFWLPTYENSILLLYGRHGPQTSLAKAVYTHYYIPDKFLDSPMEFHCSLKTFSQYFCRQMAKILLAGLFPSAFQEGNQSYVTSTMKLAALRRTILVKRYHKKFQLKSQNLPISM